MPGKVWKITGYIGFSDCDGPEDYSVLNYIVFDERFSKKTVEEFMYHFYSKKYRCVEISASDEID